ncbi:MAG: hypothetical protein KAV48_06590, partial [Methanomicrobia archaeon]|nr:hypothetical protein [Methanomicrobia archaeon]
MRRTTLVILAITCILTGCISTPTKSVIEVRPGVYVTNDLAALPLPISGYNIYLIGEQHSAHEIHQLFLTYLKMLHEAIGLRDIVLEISQGDERMLNEYLVGLIETFPSPGYKYISEILRGIREMNEALPEDEKIRVHLVVVDRDLSLVYEHLKMLQKEIGPDAEDIQLPPLEEFKELSEEELVELVDEFEAGGELSGSILNELSTIRSSIHFSFAGGYSGGRSGMCMRLEAFSIREEAIAQNIQYLLQELNGAPLLVLFGSAHATKCKAYTYISKIPGAEEIPMWAQRLVEYGVDVYSLCTFCLSGRVGKGFIPISPNDIQFADGTTLDSMLDEISD